MITPKTMKEKKKYWLGYAWGAYFGKDEHGEEIRALENLILYFLDNFRCAAAYFLSYRMAAPKIIRKMNRAKNKKALYEQLDEYVNLALDFIKKGDCARACDELFKHYVYMGVVLHVNTMEIKADYTSPKDEGKIGLLESKYR